MHQPVLAATVRETTGKGAARQLRSKSKVPAVFYGPKTAPILLAVDHSELKRLTLEAAGENILLDLHVVSDHGTQVRKAMIKDLQTDPVSDQCLHADFYEISMDRQITVNVRIRLLNTPVGITKGGVLETIQRELTVSCFPDRLTDYIDVDVSGLDMGHSLHIRDIQFPEGITPVDPGHLTVAVVTTPATGEAKATPVEEEAEGEAGETEAKDR